MEIEKLEKCLDGVLAGPVREVFKTAWGDRALVLTDLHGVVMDVSKKYALADAKFEPGSEVWYDFMRDYPTHLEDDIPIGNGREVLRRIKGKYVLAGLTGVVNDYMRRQKIRDWLNHHGYPELDALFMRPRTRREAHENRVGLDAFFKASVVEIIHAHVCPVRLVIDDRERILHHVEEVVPGVETFWFRRAEDWEEIGKLLEV